MRIARSLRQVEKCKAARLLGASSLPEARKLALAVIANARTCPCCRSMLEHLFDRVGSTLFLDDDPEQLSRAFDACERDATATHLLAACVVLRGRSRVSALETR